jgi:copper chaperone
MLHSITVDNMKCGGCANTITKSIEKIAGATSVNVDVEKGIVNFEGDASLRDPVVQRLETLGYPLAGTASGLHGAIETAKSFVSCAIGRVNK